MDGKVVSHEEILRTVGILKDPEGLNIQSREQFDRIFDEGCDGKNIQGIDEVRSLIFRSFFLLTDDEWVAETGIPIEASKGWIEPVAQNTSGVVPD